jgi:hypothetical protein
MIREMTMLEIELAELKQRLGSSHPDVSRKAASVQMYKKMVDERQKSAEAFASASKIKIDPVEILGRFVNALDQKIADLNTRLERDLADYDIHRKEAERLTVVRNRRADLEKDLAYVETLMNETKDKMFEVDPKGQLDEFNRQDGFNFESLQEASDADRIWPVLPIILAIGGLLGSLAGFGLGTLVDFADKTFHNPDWSHSGDCSRQAESTGELEDRSNDLRLSPAEKPKRGGIPRRPHSALLQHPRPRPLDRASDQPNPGRRQIDHRCQPCGLNCTVGQENSAH